MIWTGAVNSPGTYFFSHIYQTTCSIPLANINNINSPNNGNLNGKVGINITKPQKILWEISNDKKNLKDSFLKNHLLWKLFNNSSDEWSNWTKYINCAIDWKLNIKPVYQNTKTLSNKLKL